jgi:hypothetical protein
MNDDYIAGWKAGHQWALAEMREYLLQLPEDEAWVLLQCLFALTPPPSNKLPN